MFPLKKMLRILPIGAYSLDRLYNETGISNPPRPANSDTNPASHACNHAPPHAFLAQ